MAKNTNKLPTERVTKDYLIKALSQFGACIGVPYVQDKPDSIKVLDLQQSGREYRIIMRYNGKPYDIITNYATPRVLLEQIRSMDALNRILGR